MIEKKRRVYLTLGDGLHDMAFTLFSAVDVVWVPIFVWVFVQMCVSMLELTTLKVDKSAPFDGKQRATFKNVGEIEAQQVYGTVSEAVQSRIRSVGELTALDMGQKDLVKVDVLTAVDIHGELQTPAQVTIRTLGTLESDVDMGSNRIVNVHTLEAERLVGRYVSRRDADTAAITSLGEQMQDLSMPENDLLRVQTLQATKLVGSLALPSQLHLTRMNATHTVDLHTTSSCGMIHVGEFSAQYEPRMYFSSVTYDVLPTNINDGYLQFTTSSEYEDIQVSESTPDSLMIVKSGYYSIHIRTTLNSLAFPITVYGGLLVAYTAEEKFDILRQTYNSTFSWLFSETRDVLAAEVQLVPRTITVWLPENSYLIMTKYRYLTSEYGVFLDGYQCTCDISILRIQ